MILKKLERQKIDNTVPVFTLDVNQVALRSPETWPPTMTGLAPLEWNYFETPKLELCVTPETDFEITKGISVNSLGAPAYERFQKSQLFKSRPAGLTLSLVSYEADELWVGIRNILWPSVNDDQLADNQRADVSQLFFHTIAGSTMSNAAFLTIDTNFHQHRNQIERDLGIYVLTPTEAWNQYHTAYDLYQPTDREMMELWHDQNRYLAQLRTEANSIATIV
jgi:hypothetical protein